MFDLSSLNPFSRGPRKSRKPGHPRDEPVARDARVDVHPDAPAAVPGAGFHRVAGPRGLADPFDPLAIGSPAARVDGLAGTRNPDREFEVPLDRPVADRSAATKKAKSTESRLPERKPALVAARANAIRDRIKDPVDEMKKAMESPDLQTTMGQRVIGEEAARAAKLGDKTALRQSLAALVQKMNLTSPADSAVLLKQEGGLMAFGKVQGLLGQGKMTLDATPGGRMLQKIGPILKDYSPVDVQGELDGAWNGMAERFAMGAKGKVDVVLGADAAAAASQGAAASVTAAPAAGSAGAAAAAGRLPGGLSVMEAGSDTPAAGGAAGAAASGGAAATRAGSINVTEVDPSQASPVQMRTRGAPPGSTPLEVTDMYPGDSAQPVRMGKTMAPPGGIPTNVTEAADQSQHVKIERGMPPPGAINVTPSEMPADTPRTIGLQRGMPPPGAINVTPAEMSPDTPRAVVPQAGTPPPGAIKVTPVEMSPDTARQVNLQAAANTKVAGQLTLKDVVERNAGITEVHLQQVESTPKGSALKSLGSLARNALLQKLQGMGSGGVGD